MNGRLVVGHSGRSAGAGNHLDTYPNADADGGGPRQLRGAIGETARQIIT